MDYKSKDAVTLEEKRDRLRIISLNTAAKVQRAERKHQYWFDENDTRLNALLDEQSRAESKALQRRTRSSTDRLPQARSKLQKFT